MTAEMRFEADCFIGQRQGCVVDVTASGTTVSATCVERIDLTGGAVTRFLPMASAVTGRVFTFIKIDGSANAAIVQCQGSDAIESETASATSATLTAQWQMKTFLALKAGAYQDITPSGGVGAGIVGITIDGAGSEITAGLKGFVRVPYSGTLTSWTLLADQSGDIKIDVWKCVYADAPPTDADSITNGHEPELSGAEKGEDTDLSDWTSVAVTAGDVIGFSVDSVTALTRVVLEIEITRSS